METTKSKDGTEIAFERSGEGEAVILVGGALRARASDAPLARLLAPSFTVSTYDRRGRGDSGDTPPYAVEHELEDLEAVIDEMGGSAALYGSSSGANLSLEAALAGLPVSKLALHEPNFLVNGSRPPLPGAYVERLEEMVSDGRRGDAVEYFLTAAAGMPTEFVAPMRELPMFAGMEAVAHTLAYDGTVVRGFKLDANRLASITTQTLVIHGSASDGWLRASAEAVAGAIPDSRRVTLEDQEHNVAPDALAPALIEFFTAR